MSSAREPTEQKDRTAPTYFCVEIKFKFFVKDFICMLFSKIFLHFSSESSSHSTEL